MYAGAANALHSLMKNLPAPLFLVTVTGIVLATTGCSLFHKHQPKSSFKIIQEGDRNPSIINDPEVQRDSPTEKVEVETGPVNPQ